ncbi:MAG: MASE1 domain-containing protein [Verrucomicrobia bacterium]|nr:MASE1 domain-containing protein [Verrucomicrobiota bacterium]
MTDESNIPAGADRILIGDATLPDSGARWLWIVRVLGVAVLYLATAKLGFLMAIHPGNVTAVWPPSGIALAALLIWGNRLWPGIWLGAFLANTWVFKGFAVGPVDIAVGASIGVGSVLQTLAGAWLLRRCVGGNNPLTRATDVFRFVLVAMAMCVVSSTFGVSSLCTAGMADWSAFGGTWLTWWLGDLTGVLVVTPLLLAWSPPAARQQCGRLGEALLMLFALTITSLLVFGQWFQNGRYPLGFLVFPSLIWAALRFNQRVVTLAIAGLAGVAIWWTVHGEGPFAMVTTNESLLLLQTYVGVVTLATLILSASVAERQRAEEAMQKLNVNLVRQAHELAEETERAKAADRLKSAFLATMSHELRTPLNSIIGFTGLLHQGLAGPLNGEQKKQIGMVLGSSRHLLTLVNDVLDLTKIEAGDLQVSFEPFAVRDALQRCRELLMPLAERKNLRLEVRVAPEVGQIVNDRRRVEQVLINLVGNGIKFTDKGQVTVLADVLPDGAPNSGRLAANHHGAVVRIQVVDSGIGIRPEELGKLFNAFRQLDSGLNRQHEGTGLGLVICEKLLKAMGGDIAVQSQWGAGSTFTVTLPVERKGGREA